MSLRVTSAGILDTVQDLGRYGFAASGINPGGAMDMAAAKTANYLTGNPESAAVIELHYPSATFYFEQTGLAAITGADLSPSLNNTSLPLNTPLIIPAGSTLAFTQMKSGMRAYLAVIGGFMIDTWLDSYSTNTRAGAGGMNGRPLRENDIIPFRPFTHQGTTVALPWHADVAELYREDTIIRVTPGKEYPLLTDCAATIFEGNTFSISMQSDRMGYRMNGSPLKLEQPKEMISSAVTRGTIQLLPNGQLIILMADHQTTGGYPRLGHVITADLPTLAQLRPNTAIRFEMVSLEEAESLLLDQQRHLQQIRSACTFKLQEFLSPVTATHPG